MITYPRGVPKLRDELIETWQTYGKTMIQKPGDASPEGEIKSLRQAELIWVAADMCRLWNVAEKSLPTDAVLDMEDLPSDFGFIVLEEPLDSIDSVRAEEERMRIRAFSWSMARVEGDFAVHLAFYMDVDRFPTLKPAGYRGNLVYTGNSEWFFKTRVDDFTNKAYANRELFPGGGPPQRAMDSMTEDRRRLATLLLLLRQPIVVDSVSKPLRQEARQAIRKKQIAPDVRVLTLREKRYKKDESDEHHAVDWSHRWMVDGHWRWQWYPSQETHKRIWIFAYQKGPEDKPLIIRPTVRAWRR